MIEEVISGLRADMSTTVESLRRDLARVRTGRANPSLLEGLLVDYYGTPTSIQKLATVSAPESQLLVVQPFDASSIGEIEKAIRNSDLGLSPVSDGKILRVPIPALTEERRREFVKLVRKHGESHRISGRNHRRDANDMLKELLTDKEISEDELHRAQDQVQQITDDLIKQIDELVEAKEQEVMAV